MNQYNWLIHTNIKDISSFKSAIKKMKVWKDVSGSTSAIGSKQFELYDGVEYITLIKDYIKLYHKVNPFFDVKIFDKLKSHSMWSVEGSKNSYHKLHRHSPDGDEKTRYNYNLSTVFFLNVPKNKPKGQFYCLLETKKGTELTVIEPRVGDLLIFPWSLYHGVYPQGEGKRKTINLDFK